MQLSEKVEGLIVHEVERLGYELVKCEAFFTGRRRNVRIFIDRSEGVTIDDCVEVTKAVGFVLDGIDEVPGPYNLEVSSPGFNRPLTKLEHFERFRGGRARIEYMNDSGARETAVGEITGVAERSVGLSVEGMQRTIRFDAISRANLEPEGRDVPKLPHSKRAGRRPGKRF
jgi:ribosome maturation factor RimP